MAYRDCLPFRAVNHKHLPDYDPGLQRHHLLPRQLMRRGGFNDMLDAIGHARLHFDDFRANGMLLPCAESAALRLGLPMHRGPHPRYTELVGERIGQIEGGWAQLKHRDPHVAVGQAHMRLTLLQRALRRFLLEGRRRKVRLNRFDPGGQEPRFAELDAMADAIWGATEWSASTGLAGSESR